MAVETAPACRQIGGSLVSPGGIQPTLAVAGQGVGVGRAVEERPGFAWQLWQDWLRSLLRLAA